MLKILIIFFSLYYFISATRFHVIREWKYINYTWNDPEVLQTAIHNEFYIPENNLIAGIKYYKNYYYLTIPRMKNGVPVTLARIPSRPITTPAPLLEPYPSWEMNDVNDCGGLQFVQNIEIDAKGLLWIIDTGRINTLTTPITKCPPKILIYNIESNRVQTLYNFPEHVASRDDVYLYDLVVDNTDGGYAYITDNSGIHPGIIVYSLKENRAWKIYDLQSMSANPNAVQLTVNGIRITSAINIAAIALGPKIINNNRNLATVTPDDRQVYYSPLSSFNLYSVNSTSLRNGRNNADVEIRDLGMKKSQSISMIMDNKGILYYTLLGLDGIGRWDSETTFSNTDNQKLIAQDEKYIEWPHAFTFDRSGNLTVVVNRLNRFIYNKTDLNTPNFRLISANVGGDSYIYENNYNYEPQNGNNGIMNSTSSTSTSISSSSPTSSSSSSPTSSSASSPTSSSETSPMSPSTSLSSSASVPTSSLGSSSTSSSASSPMSPSTFLSSSASSPTSSIGSSNTSSLGSSPTSSLGSSSTSSLESSPTSSLGSSPTSSLESSPTSSLGSSPTSSSSSSSSSSSTSSSTPETASPSQSSSESSSASTSTLTSTTNSTTIHPDLENHQKSVHQVHTQSSATNLIVNSLLFFIGFFILLS